MDTGLIPGSEVPLEEGMALQYPCLENPMEEEPGGLESMGPKQLDATEVI